jgi:hypothetical protein
MLKKFFLFIGIISILPVYADFKPLSDAPIRSPEEFYNDESADNEPMEFEYPTQENRKPFEVKPTEDYTQIYNDLQPADFSYLHDIDPDQYYDMKDSTWSPYPLLRLNSPIYFKDRTIEPGYYLLTPREHNGKWYMLFKQNGLVVHIIPTYDRGITPEFFYEKNIAQPKLTKAQKAHMGGLSFLAKFKSTKRQEQVQCFMEINDLENYFVSIVIYYGSHRYSTIFRTIKL